MTNTAPALGLLLLASLAAAQAPTPAPAPNAPPPPASTQPTSPDPITTLKVTTRVVEVSAVVLSKSGEPAGGLTRDDFILKEDGHDEPIHYFSQGSALPLTLALLVDTSGSQRTFINDESLAADVFFETMLDQETDTAAHAPNRAMLVQFDTTLHQLSNMTTSAGALHLALSRLGPDLSTHGGTLLDDAVFAVAKGPLAHESGRKAIVILSDGGDNGSRTSITQAIEEAQRNNTQIFSIRYSAWSGFSGGPHTNDPGISTLQKLSESTGGRVFNVSRSESLRTIFAEIAADLRLEYELGYTPPPDLAPNSYHKLEVRTRDHALTVQARKGFFAQP